MDQVIQQIMEGHCQAIPVGKPTVLPRQPCCILSGSFNPVHRGHREMARIARLTSGWPVEFELSLTNVDKQPLACSEVVHRLEQFPDDCVWLTRAPTFLEKSQLFPNCTFAIGADTAVRLLDPKYCVTSVEQVIAEIRDRGCRFLVFGRTVGNQFLAKNELPISDRWLDLFEFVAKDRFHIDVSSTDMRRKNDRSD